MAESGRLISRRRFLQDGTLLCGGLAVGPSLLALPGCRCGASDEATAEGDSVSSSSRVPESWDQFDQRMGLRDFIHLADVDHHGTFVDFGTAARYKYTLGNWRSGWGADVEEQGVTYTWTTGSPARCYFQLERPVPLQLILRAKPGNISSLSVYINDQPVSRISLPSGWSEQRVTVEANKTRPGENSLKLVHGGGEADQRSFAVDSLRIIPGEGDPVVGPEFLAPTVETLVRSVQVGEAEEPALVLRAPSRISFYLELPPAAQLGFGLALLEGADAVATVQVTDASNGRSATAHRTELRAGEAQGQQQVLVDLGAFGGKAVRLDLDLQSQAAHAEVAWTTPTLLTPRARVQAGASQPVSHVIVLLIDTLRADALPLYATTRVRSPELEQFAQEGTIFERCQAPANWTKPSCASVLTGLHPLSHRALTEGAAMSSSVRMGSEMFQAAGFQTGAFIANGYLATEFGFNRGWSSYRNYIRERIPTEAEYVFRDVIAWLEQNKDNRTFTYIQTIDPHVPYDPPAEDLQIYDAQPYQGPIQPRSTGNLLEDFKRGRVQFSPRDRERLRALYDGEVTYHDRQLGLFFARLRELGLLDNTLFVVTADHGEEFFEHESVGHGHSLHQELLHVPLLFRMPGLVPAGARAAQSCSLVDILPTALEAAGLEIPPDIEGRSLVPDFRGQPAPLWGASFSSMWDTGNQRETSWAVRVADWKLRMHGPANSFLYDLSRDRREEKDLDEAHPLALRLARIALGQFLGAPDKKQWMAAATQGVAAPPVRHADQEAKMTPELCQQLHALGYVDACE